MRLPSAHDRIVRQRVHVQRGAVTAPEGIVAIDESAGAAVAADVSESDRLIDSMCFCRHGHSLPLSALGVQGKCS